MQRKLGRREVAAGLVQLRLPDRTVLDISKVSNISEAMLGLRFSRFGNVILYQKKGIAIGGPMSPSHLYSHCSVLEHIWDVQRWPVLAVKFGLPLEREKSICVASFADNTTGASPYFCSKCLVDLLCSVYEPHLPYSEDTTSYLRNDFIAIKFLDFWICLAHQSSRPQSDIFYVLPHY